MKKKISAIVILLIIFMSTTAAAAPSWPILKNGSSGTNVKSMQYLLNAQGYSLTADGIFGSGTESIVKSFQSAKGFTSDGIVGSGTWSKLVLTVSNGSTGSAVKALQTQLSSKYGYSVTVDGIFGSGTESAVRSFQSKNGITSDGIVGPTTWQYLIGGGSTSDFWGSRSAWVHPLKGGPTSDPTTGGRYFGASRDGGRAHAAIDFTAPDGRIVYSMTSGTVIRVSDGFYAGTQAVEVKNDDGTVARYCEIRASVTVNSRVSAGSKIGTVMASTTGSQMLHLEVYMGTVSGALTDTSNSSNYLYVPIKNYQRRADLVDPMGAMYLSIIP